MKTEASKLYSTEFGIFLPNAIKIDPCNFELYCFKIGVFFETQIQRIFFFAMGYCYVTSPAMSHAFRVIYSHPVHNTQYLFITVIVLTL